MQVLDDDSPIDIDLENGSREIVHVVKATETLHEYTVQNGEVASFSGDIFQAYSTSKNGLALLKRLGNRRAEGAANHNMGLSMFAFYRLLQATKLKRIG